MIPKQIIELSIEGGWQGKLPKRDAVALVDEFATWDWERFALDPTFWQALGKALGWWKPIVEGEKLPSPVPVWRQHARKFYHLILTGGDTEKFWEELLA